MRSQFCCRYRRDPGSGGQFQDKFSGKFIRMCQDVVRKKQGASPNLWKKTKQNSITYLTVRILCLEQFQRFVTDKHLQIKRQRSNNLTLNICLCTFSCMFVPLEQIKLMEGHTLKKKCSAGRK